METLLAYLKSAGRSSTTIACYTRDIDTFSAWFEATNGEPLTPQRLTPTDVRDYRLSMLSDKLMPGTINRRLSALRAYAAAHQVAIGQVKMQTCQTGAPRWLDKHELHKLIRELDISRASARTQKTANNAVRDIAIVTTMVWTGLRIGEITALELDDLEIRDRGGKVVVRSGKGGKRREVPLTATARQALRAWLAIRPEGCCTRKVFVGQRWEPLSGNAIQRTLAEYARRAGIEGMTPHRLRHTFAKNLIDTGASLEKIAALLGHDSLESTKVYIQPGENDLRLAVERLEM